MKLSELMLPYSQTTIADCNILGLSNDSRTIKTGFLFLAYPGALHDGRSFISIATKLGAAAILYDNEHMPTNLILPISIPCIGIAHLNSKLAEIADRFFKSPSRNLNITAITGTNGKTTIAYQLAQAYDLCGQKSAYIGTLGAGEIQNIQPLSNTTPDSLCLQQILAAYNQNAITHVCMEVSSHALDQGRTDNTCFKQAIYTNLSHDHLDYHHTLEAYACAKAKLFANPSLQYAIINCDDAHSAIMIKAVSPNCQILSYGLNDNCDVRALSWNTQLSGSELKVMSPWGIHEFRVNLIGEFNIYNSLAIFSSLLANGMKAHDAVSIMAKLRPSPGRMELIARTPYVIVDYAHTPDALEKTLLTLTRLKSTKLWLVFGCGGDRDKTKRPIMGSIASKYADIIVLTSDNPRNEEPAQIIDEIAQGLSTHHNVYKTIDRAEAIRLALTQAEATDIILIAGKGHETYQEITQVRLPFSDKEMVLGILNLN